MSSDLDFEHRLRQAAFAWPASHGDAALPRRLLQRGFEFAGERVCLKSRPGIFKPRRLRHPLSITTSFKGPYQDKMTAGAGFLYYKYRGADPQHGDNAGLTEAMKLPPPLVCFHGVDAGKYPAERPVRIIDDNPGALEFKVDLMRETVAPRRVAEERPAEKTCAGRTMPGRLRRRAFRRRALRACRDPRSICRLRRRTLLDASHIIPDADERGAPAVDNGISLRKIHPAALDRFLPGAMPDFQIVVRGDILQEKDGPMLQHGLKEIHGGRIILPRQKEKWPNQDALDERCREFQRAA